MPLIARQRSRLAVLAVLALVGSLLAVSAVPVAAGHNTADDTADQKAMYSACVGAATEDAGFTDMGNSFAAAAANCLAHYGITVGTGGGMFSPDKAVTRLAMARFLYRAAGPAGVDMTTVTDQNLTDTDSKEANAVASLGIMAPRSTGVFDPSGLVSRADMAVHLAAFLSKATTSPGGVDIDDLKDSHASGDSPFTDISEVSVSAHKAIRDIFELGVTTGTTATTFSPTNPVSRAQMAAFITRAMAHTNARPAGLSAQGPANADTDDEVTISVSVRGEDHAPTPDALVAEVNSMDPSKAFDDQGACATGTDAPSGTCTMKTSNEATDPDGNAEIEFTTPDKAGTLTVWVWSGENGDKFDADTTTNVPLEIDLALPATHTNVTDDTKENAEFLKFGDTVTYTLQVVNTDDGAVAKAGASVTVQATITDVTVDTSEGTSDQNPALEGRQLRSTTSTKTTVHKTDSAGMIQVSFTQDDPDGKVKNRDKVALTLALSGATHTLDSSKVNDMDEADGAVTTDNTFQAIWSDADSAATTLTLSQDADYDEIDDTGGGGVTNVVKATLVDQYGDPVKNQKVSIWSTDGGGSGSTDAPWLSEIAGTATNPGDNRTTNRSAGVATKRYTRSGKDVATEVIDANYVTVKGTCRDTDTDCNEENDGKDSTTDTVTIADDKVTDLSHYWAKRVTSGTTLNTASAVLVADKDNDSIVLTEGTSLVTYKAGDYFLSDAADGTGSAVAVSMDVFEQRLDKGDNVSVTFADSGINTFTLDNPTSG